MPWLVFNLEQIDLDLQGFCDLIPLTLFFSYHILISKIGIFRDFVVGSNKGFILLSHGCRLVGLSFVVCV